MGPAALACTDAERRLARAAAARLRAAGREARVEALWVRPAWAPVLAALAAAGVLGSVLSVERPALGLAVSATALVLALAEAGPLPLARRLTTYARATQDVVSPPRSPRAVTLVLATATDRPRGGVLRRLHVAARPVTIAALAPVTAFAAARVALDASGTAIGAAQLVPSAALVLMAGGLVDAAVAAPADGPGAVDAVVGAAIALDAEPPARVAVEVVLAGAWPLGLRERLRRDRRRPQEIAIVLVEAAPAGFSTAHPTLRAAAARTGIPRRRGTPRAGRGRPALALAAPAGSLADELVALARGLDAELAQPASGERSAKSEK
jgi:hypothetical protein